MKLNLRRLQVFGLLVFSAGCSDEKESEATAALGDVEVHIRSLSRSQERLSGSVDKLTAQVTEFESELKAKISDTQELLELLRFRMDNAQSQDFMNVSTHYAVIELLSGHADSLFKEIVLKNPPAEVVRVLEGIRSLDGNVSPVPTEDVYSAIDLDWSRIEYLGGGAVGGWTSYVPLTSEFILVINDQFGVRSLKVCERPIEHPTTADLDAISSDIKTGHPLSPVFLADGVREVYQSADGRTVIYKRLDEPLQEAVRGHFRSRNVLPSDQYDEAIPPWPTEDSAEGGDTNEAEKGATGQPAARSGSDSESGDKSQPESERRSR